MIPVPSRETIARCLDYDARTGVFIRKPRSDRGPRWHERFANKEAGVLRPDGYVQIYVEGTVYLAHHLAWVHEFGNLPEFMEEMDHKNGMRTDNRIANLRPATIVQNRANSQRPRTRKSRLPRGVRPSGEKFQARIYRHGRECCLGTFGSVEDASLAYRHAAIQESGEFARLT